MEFIKCLYSPHTAVNEFREFGFITMNKTSNKVNLVVESWVWMPTFKDDNTGVRSNKHQYIILTFTLTFCLVLQDVEYFNINVNVIRILPKSHRSLNINLSTYSWVVCKTRKQVCWGWGSGLKKLYHSVKMVYLYSPHGQSCWCFKWEQKDPESLRKDDRKDSLPREQRLFIPDNSCPPPGIILY